MNEREVGGGDKNVGEGGLIKMECPILFSAPPPPHFLFRSAVAGLLSTVDTYRCADVRFPILEIK